MNDLIACPLCRSELSDRHEQQLHCNGCNNDFGWQDGIAILGDNNVTFYWGVDQPKMQKMLAKSRESGWQNAMHELVDELPPKEADLLWKRTFWPVRVALQSLIVIRKSDVVLEIGPGWGGIARFIASNCHRYVAMDQALLHLKWIKELAKASRISNIELVCSGNDRYLPFKTNCFDKVIMNGVLEWVASNSKGDPAKVQQNFMNEVYRILKPSGQVYVGIENRINYKYFLGSPEGHIRMKYGSLLPRFVTRWYLKHARGQDFLEYTYTLLGYRKLLLRSGFGNRRYYSTCPHYSGIRRIYPISFKTISRPDRPWKKLISNERFSKLRYNIFSHCFGFTGLKKGTDPLNLIEWVLRDLQKNTIIKSPNVIDALCKITSTGKAVVLLEQSGKKYWLSIGLTDYAQRVVEKNIRAIRFLEQHDSIAECIKRFLPKLIFSGSWENYTYSLEEYIEGNNGYYWCHDKTKRDAFNKDVYNFILAMTKSSPFVEVTSEDFERLVAKPIDNFKNWFSESIYTEKYQNWLDKCKKWLEQSLLGVSSPLVPRHGDLVPSNCIVANGKLSTVLDWELFEEKGLPALDMIVFIGNSYRSQIRGDYEKKGIDPDSLAFHGYPEMFLDGLFKSWLDRYISDSGINPKLCRPLLFMWLMTYMNDMLEMHQFNPAWKKLRSCDKADAWKKIMAF